MKKFKAILALALVVVMICGLFAACNNSSSGNNSGNSGNNTAPAELTKIVLAYLDVSGNEQAEWDRQEAYINSISEPAIGVTVDLMVGQMGDYGTTVPMMIAGNEQLDLVNVCPVGAARYTTLLGNGSLKDISAELKEFAPQTLEIVGGMIKNYQVGDAIYGVPSNRISTSNEYMILRKDILEELGMVEKAQNCSSWTELEEIYAAAYDYCKDNNMYVTGGQKVIANQNAIWTGDAFSTGYQLDKCADTTGLIYADQETGKFSFLYDNQDFINGLKRTAQWKENGWIYPDSILGDDHTDNLFKQGVIFSYTNHTEIGVEVARFLSSGYEVVAPMTCPGIVQGSNLGFGIAVTSICQEVEAAVKFIELLYTDARISTVFAWGIEGEDYVMVDGEADYTDPKSPFHAQDYMIGNQMLVPAWKGQGADFRARAEQSNKDAVNSRYVGFNIDTADLATTISALNSVIDEYRPGLLCGDYTDAMLKDFSDKLNSVCLQDYLNAAQTQLDAWLAVNG